MTDSAPAPKPTKKATDVVAVERWALEEALTFLPHAQVLRPIGLENYFRGLLGDPPSPLSAGATIDVLRRFLSEYEPTLARRGDEIFLYCPSAAATDDLYRTLEEAISQDKEPAVAPSTAPPSREDLERTVKELILSGVAYSASASRGYAAGEVLGAEIVAAKIVAAVVAGAPPAADGHDAAVAYFKAELPHWTSYLVEQRTRRNLTRFVVEVAKIERYAGDEVRVTGQGASPLAAMTEAVARAKAEEVADVEAALGLGSKEVA